MDLARYVVDAVVLEGRSQRSVAGAVNRSVGWVNKQVVRYRSGGYEALAPQKRGARSFPNQTPVWLEDEIVDMRKQLDEDGLDAGPKTIRYHLKKRHGSAPALSTIHAVLTRRGFVTPQPQKRPKSSWKRFESDLPNEMWQGDMTHWALAGGEPVEIINHVDDHSRLVTACDAVEVATSSNCVAVFHKATDKWGLPASMLTDNGAIYTASYRDGRSAMETEMYSLGIVMKHGKPYHPQTQGKIERFHKTLKRWLNKQPRAETIEALQLQLDYFVSYYNEVRPHSANLRPGTTDMMTPLEAWNALDKAAPVFDGEKLPPQTRVRHDKVDKEGRFTLRHNGRLHHIGMGRAHKGKRIVVLIADLDIRVLTTERELLRHLTLDPTRDYQRHS